MGRKILIGVAVAAVGLLAVTALMVAGFALGRGTTLLGAPMAALRGAAWDNVSPCGAGTPYGGMMRGGREGGAYDDDRSACPFDGRVPGGRMGGQGGRPGQPFGGMMRGFGQGAPSSVEPLTVDEAKAAAEGFLKQAGLESLTVAEVLVFDNHAYVEVMDPSTGEGALEMLVDPVSKSAFLEFGPSMMWNTSYGMHSDTPLGMAGRGGMRWMMGDDLTAPAGDPTVTAAQAVTLAQAYLDKEQPGLSADTTAEVFPGYFTLHVLKDGAVTGMLSVNGYTGQVWYHAWHGDLVDSLEID